MDDSPHGQSDTPDDTLGEVDTKSDANTGLSESDEENIEGAVGGAINQDKQQDGNIAQHMCPQTCDIIDNDSESQITSDEGKVMEGAVGGAKVSCDQCETEIAITFCQNCPGHLCKICYGVHKRSKLTRNHSYINISPIMLTSSQNTHIDENTSCNIYCNSHSTNLANSICNTCVYPICSDCKQQHEEHAVVGLEQECIRQLQSTCMDDFQLLLKLVSNLETLQETKSSEDMYSDALQNMALVKQNFNDWIGKGGGHTLIVESLGREKKEVIEKHNTKLDDITNILDETKFVMSQLHFAGSSTDINLVFAALNYFYIHYTALMAKHANLLVQTYKTPDNSQLKAVNNYMTSLDNAFKRYKNPNTRYDKRDIFFDGTWRTLLDFVAISRDKFLYTSEDCLLAYFDITTKDISDVCSIKEYAFRLAIVSEKRIFAQTTKSYIILDEKLNQISISKKMANHRAFSTWDNSNILVLTFDKKGFKIFLLNIEQNTHKSTILFETSDITDVDCNDIFIMSRNMRRRRREEVIIVEQRYSKLYRFDRAGKLLFSGNLLNGSSANTQISSFCVDKDDNYFVGCTNGNVYFVDAKTIKYKLLLSHWGPVMRVSEIDDVLYVFVCFFKHKEGASQSNLYVYKMEQSVNKLTKLN